ncbi:MAG: hypothetical protein KDE34_26080, partial [Anaerolineales bacterium]|nr:hypothetical protein [Anaerolineales bacterium]
LTPDEFWVHQQGLEPDYFIPLPEVNPGEVPDDTQLQAAVDYLLGNPVVSIPPTLEQAEESNP